MFHRIDLKISIWSEQGLNLGTLTLDEEGYTEWFGLDQAISIFQQALHVHTCPLNRGPSGIPVDESLKAPRKRLELLETLSPDTICRIHRKGPVWTLETQSGPGVLNG